MKNYFDFNLAGRKLLPIWIAFLLLFVVPYSIIILKMQNIQVGDTSSLILLPLLLLVVIIAFFITFYIRKLSIENISYNNESIQFNGKFGKYMGIVLLGFFLTTITLGIYGAWFVRDIYRFFVDNTSYKSNNLKFQGKGGKLLLIMLLAIIIPIVVLTIVMAQFLISYSESSALSILFQIIIMVIAIPYAYLSYKWMVDIKYKEYQISWDTKFWESCGKIAIELLLTVITLGIYYPLAMLRLYKYFTQKTCVENNEVKMKLGYDIEQSKDFLFIWGQTLLSIITLGIYYPWAFCKISKRVLSKTYLESN